MAKHSGIIRTIHATLRDRPNRWESRHLKQWRNHPIANMIHALADYADDYERRFDSRIGDDGVLGDHWRDALEAVRGLLNGETGGLDCGTVDRIIAAMLAAEGFEE